MRKVAVVAQGACKFGIRQATYRDLIAEAGVACFASAPCLRPKDIEGYIQSSVLPERAAYQTHVAPLGAECLGIEPSKVVQRVELLCASGSSAIRTAYAFIASGLADVIMVLGVEKMHTPNPPENILNMMAGVDKEWEQPHGLMAPAGFALITQLYMQKYGIKKEQLALVAVKNRENAAKNPICHFQKPITVADVLNSKPINPPLNLLDCSPMTDGAAAMVLASEDRAKEFSDNPIYILGLAQAGKGNNTSNVTCWTSWPLLSEVAGQAYRMAGVTPADIDVAEVHDCFTVSEIIEYEGLGFCKCGQGVKFLEEGKSRLDGELPVNPGGGLLSRGHPLGATGIAQGVEIVSQLQGQAGTRQVKGASVGLTHNLSGFATEHTVIIYGR